MDALDGVVADFSTTPPRLLATCSKALPQPLSRQLHALCVPGDNELTRMGEADIHFARFSAAVVNELLDTARLSPAQIVAIGSHGQTIRHSPNSQPPFTLQIGDPNTIAELTGITTVADLRRRDMAAGGQGAPLVPGFHAALYRQAGEDRVVLNLGGIANITILPGELSEAVRGFDTGPANTLLDSWIRQQLGKGMDGDGAWGRSGRHIPQLLSKMLEDPYFSAPAPKSTGREYFNLRWLQHLLIQGEHPPADVQATLYALTVESVARAIEVHAPATRQLVVCGGGVYNGLMMAKLRERLAPCPVLSSAEASPAIEPRWMEAMAFAWLARQTVLGESGNLPAVTGASRAVILGGIYPAA